MNNAKKTNSRSQKPAGDARRSHANAAGRQSAAPAWRNRRSPAWLAGVLLLAASALLLAIVLPDRSEPAVASLSGHDITEAELAFHMSQLEQSVRSEFRSKHQVSLGKADWTRSYDGVQPLQQLRQRALEASLEDKALLLLAQEQRLIDSADFSAILQRMEQENRSRAAAVARGDIVYGLQRFSPESYYPHLLTALKTGLKQALSKHEGDPLYLNREEVEAYFDAHQSEWAVNGTSYKVSRLLIPAAQEDKADTLLAVGSLVERQAGLAELRERYEHTELTEETIEPGQVANLNTYGNEAAARVSRLSPGELSAPVETREGVSVYRLDEVIFDKEQALQAYRVQIREHMLEERLQAYIREVLASAVVEVHTDRLEQVAYDA
ncbi:peptidyl-prolyl cis-trans isomerase [Paenibacillus sp. 1P07SE]|uniref:peptidylprolyl isomerase n=1 Tax=Paenibacillus sp. 1P07SE TaxID=3132209 RepID=UPI0039A708F9